MLWYLNRKQHGDPKPPTICAPRPFAQHSVNTQTFGAA